MRLQSSGLPSGFTDKEEECHEVNIYFPFEFRSRILEGGEKLRVFTTAVSCLIRGPRREQVFCSYGILRGKYLFSF
jgi:hypothetical protein